MCNLLGIKCFATRKISSVKFADGISQNAKHNNIWHLRKERRREDESLMGGEKWAADEEKSCAHIDSLWSANYWEKSDGTAWKCGSSKLSPRPKAKMSCDRQVIEEVGFWWTQCFTHLMTVRSLGQTLVLFPANENLSWIMAGSAGEVSSTRKWYLMLSSVNGNFQSEQKDNRGGSSSPLQCPLFPGYPNRSVNNRSPQEAHSYKRWKKILLRMPKNASTLRERDHCKSSNISWLNT